MAKSPLTRFASLVVAVSLCAVGHAEDKQVARAAFAEGQRRYDLNEFNAALAAFKQAYLAYEEPVFLFNIAQCYRQLGDKGEAIKFYRSYLRKVPDAPNRDDVKSLVSTLENEVASAKAAAPPPTTPILAAPPPSLIPPPQPTGLTAVSTSVRSDARPKPLYKRWWLWTIVGAAAAGAATGVAVAVTSRRSEPSLMPVTVTP